MLLKVILITHPKTHILEGYARYADILKLGNNPGEIHSLVRGSLVVQFTRDSVLFSGGSNYRGGMGNCEGDGAEEKGFAGQFGCL